jgi:hypothetical protein
MNTKLLRILTLILYFGIQIDGEHIGGPLIMFFLFELYWMVLILIALAVLLVTIFDPGEKRDKVIVPVGLIILSIPPGLHLVDLIERSRWHNATPFIITAGLFFILSGHWVWTVLRKRNTANTRR